jgi:hypothetical protein
LHNVKRSSSKPSRTRAVNRGHLRVVTDRVLVLGALYWSAVGQQYEYVANDQQRSADDSLTFWERVNVGVEDIFCPPRRGEGDAQAENIANAAQPEAKSILAILISFSEFRTPIERYSCNPAYDPTYIQNGN